jgi:hypothetical protein
LLIKIKPTVLRVGKTSEVDLDNRFTPTTHRDLGVDHTFNEGDGLGITKLMVIQEAQIEVALTQLVVTGSLDDHIGPVNTGVQFGLPASSSAATALEGVTTAQAAERTSSFAEPGILADTDDARRGLRVEFLAVDAVFGDVLDDVREVIVFDGLDELEGVIGDPAELTVDLEVTFGVGGRDHRILHHLEILPIKVRFLAKIGLPGMVLTTKKVGTYYHKITILSIYNNNISI